VQEAQAAAVRLKSKFTQDREELLHLNGVDCVRDYLATLYDSVEDELLTFAPGGAQTAANVPSSRPLAENLLARCADAYRLAGQRPQRPCHGGARELAGRARRTVASCTSSISLSPLQATPLCLLRSGRGWKPPHRTSLNTSACVSSHGLTLSSVSFSAYAALSSGSRCLTYGELAAASTRTAALLQREGPRRRDRIAVTAADGIGIAVLIYAASRLGAVFCVLHEQARGGPLENVLRDCDPSCWSPTIPTRDGPRPGMTCDSRLDELVRTALAAVTDVPFTAVWGKAPSGCLIPETQARGNCRSHHAAFLTSANGATPGGWVHMQDRPGPSGAARVRWNHLRWFHLDWEIS
jgi:hypothetical protein